MKSKSRLNTDLTDIASQLRKIYTMPIESPQSIQDALRALTGRWPLIVTPIEVVGI